MAPAQARLRIRRDMKTSPQVVRPIRRLKDAIKAARAVWRRASIAPRLPVRQVTDNSAVVVAPHPDDETFGAGGLIALKRALDVPVTVILLTDGAASLSALPEILPEEVGRVRRQQAVAAAGHPGVDAAEVIGLGLTDGQIPRRGQPGFDQTVDQLAGLLVQCNPAEIYCPHPHDGLPDHEATSEITLAAVSRCQEPRRVAFYVIWAWLNAASPLRARFDLQRGWRLDIHQVYEKKRAAMASYLNGQCVLGRHPYCGHLPWGGRRTAIGRDEVFFSGRDVQEEWINREARE